MIWKRAGAGLVLGMAFLAASVAVAGGVGLADLIAGLSSEDPVAREQAAAQLLDEGVRDPDRVIPALRAVKSEDQAVTVQCRQIAARIPFEAARREALALAGNDPGLRLLLDDYMADPAGRSFWLIRNTFGEDGREALGAAGRALLLSEWPKMRAAGIRTATHLKDARSVPLLLVMLESEATRMRPRILGALGEIRDPAAAPAIRAHLDDPDEAMRFEAVKAYALLGGKKVLPELARFKRDACVNIRIDVAWRYWEWKDPAAIPLLAEFLQDENAKVQDCAEMALKEHGKPGARAVVPLLAHTLDDVRRRAVIVIGSAGDASMSSCLMPLLGDPYMGVRGVTINALGKLGNPEVVPEVRKFLSAESPQRGPAARALAALGDRASIDAIVRQLKDEKGSARLGAVEALVVFGETEPIKEMIGDEHPNIREIAFGLLEKQNDRAAMTGIATLLDDKDPGIRKRATNTLLRFVGQPDFKVPGGSRDDRARWARSLWEEYCRSLDANN